MIEVDVSVTPVGTSSTSISDYIAESEKALKCYPDLHFKITSMSTEIEGENIDDIFNALKDMHMAQINKGAQRVTTSIRIDDRRDKKADMRHRVESVAGKL